jgi:hypothetical protein
MGDSFGHRGVVGFAKESTFGTRVAPTKFLEVTPSGYSVGLQTGVVPKHVLNTVRQKYHVPKKKGVSGGMEFWMPYQGAELLFEAALGAVSSAQIGSTGVYTHTFVPAETLPTGLSFYREPDYTGVAQAYAHIGCQIAKLTLTQDQEEFMKCAIEVLGQDETEVAQASPTYPTFKGVDWTQVSTMTLDGQTYNVRMAELVIENALAEDRYKLGSQLRVGIGRGGVRKVSGKVEVELTAKAIYDLYRDATPFAIALAWEGPIAAGSTHYGMTIDLPVVIPTGSTPKVDGHGPIKIELPFECFYDVATPAHEVTITLSNLLTSVS